MQSRKIPDWHLCEIDRRELKQLMRRNDRVGLLWLAGHFGALIVTGYLAYLAVGTWWVVPAFMAYGSIYTFAVSILHETHHGTPFRSRWINETVHFIAGLMVLRDPIYDRWAHTNHHSFTIFPGIDLEILAPRPAPLGKMALDFTRILYVARSLPKVILHSFGYVDAKTRSFVPESEIPKMVWSSRAFVLFYAGVIGLALYTGSILPLLYTAGAQLYGAFLYVLVSYTQHAGLADNVEDHRLNTRTMYLNPILRFLYWNMNYHIEHHMFPMVPFYNLPKLHRLVKSQLPRPSAGLVDAYREILPALIRQQRDPDHIIHPDLPEARPQQQPA
ncbi:fatty acid desaturase [Thalassobaculum sp.]|uniref:fatty acid desaturase n=1 Tax=Thalassobaculum sp. TaxID=2022740 RepID=UPI003B5AE3B2